MSIHKNSREFPREFCERRISGNSRTGIPGNSRWPWIKSRMNWLLFLFAHFCLSVCRFFVFLLYFISRIYVLHCICYVRIKVLITLAMRLRCRRQASAGTIRHSLSYSCCWSRRIEALRYLRHTLLPATARRPPTTHDEPPDTGRDRWGWRRRPKGTVAGWSKRGRDDPIPTAAMTPRRGDNDKCRPTPPNFRLSIATITTSAVYRYCLIIQCNRIKRLKGCVQLFLKDPQ